MSTSRNRDRKGRRRRSGKGKKMPFVPTQFEKLQCHICNEIIEDVTSAISYPGEVEPSHFDCVIKRLRENEAIKEDEKIIYLGSNTFAVVKESEYNKREFNIVRKLEIGRPEDREEWRYKMRQELQC